MWKEKSQELRNKYEVTDKEIKAIKGKIKNKAVFQPQPNCYWVGKHSAQKL